MYNVQCTCNHYICKALSKQFYVFSIVFCVFLSNEFFHSESKWVGACNQVKMPIKYAIIELSIDFQVYKELHNMIIKTFVTAQTYIQYFELYRLHNGLVCLLFSSFFFVSFKTNNQPWFTFKHDFSHEYVNIHNLLKQISKHSSVRIRPRWEPRVLCNGTGYWQA